MAIKKRFIVAGVGIASFATMGAIGLVSAQSSPLAFVPDSVKVQPFVSPSVNTPISPASSSSTSSTTDSDTKVEVGQVEQNDSVEAVDSHDSVKPSDAKDNDKVKHNNGHHKGETKNHKEDLDSQDD
ncbi:MAG: hypothetical protein NVS3B23_06970 [Candidatus Saccharimonadales bacterium]